MTTYAYDNWILLPTRDLYDTQVMAMAINAARDMYEKGEQRIKDFNTKYGDFITPIQADQDWYNLNVTGRVRDTINNLYARGIDPLRSAEGRAVVALLVNNIPIGEVAKLRSSAKNAEEYIKNRGLLEAAGKYNQDLEERFLGYNLANWDTLGGGLVWNRTSPTEMKTLKELTESWYNNRTARDLTEEDLKAARIPYDKRYQYSGYLDSDILNVARGNTPGWNDSVYSRYYRDLAERQLAASGIPYTKQDVEARLQRNIADAQQEWLINPTKKADEFAVAEQDYKYKMALEGQRHKNAMNEAAAKQLDYSGGYLLGLAISAMGQNIGAKNALLLDPRTEKELKNVEKITDSKKRAKELDRINTNMMIRFLNTKANGTGNRIVNMIKNLENNNQGSSGRDIVNNILSNFATNSNDRQNGLVVLESLGYEQGDKAGTYVLPAGTRVLSPHQLLTNIINHGSGEFKDKQLLLKALQSNADTSNNLNWLPDWNLATTNSIANRTSIVKPTATNKGVIVAPDENGINRMYMKVRTISDSMFDGDHDGFWIETPITYGAGGITSDNTPLIQGSEEMEGKLFGNSQRKEAFENRRD